MRGAARDGDDGDVRGETLSRREEPVEHVREDVPVTTPVPVGIVYAVKVDRPCVARLRFAQVDYCTWCVKDTADGKFDLSIGGYPLVVKSGDEGFVETSDADAVVTFETRSA